MFIFQNRDNKGFTFIEIVVSAALFLTIIVGGYQGYASLYDAISHSHYRMTAADLANEHFEAIKNLPYASVGTVGGTPTGVIQASQVLSRGGVNYLVATVVQNVNDPFDGAGDAFPNDYKKIQVTIVCQSCPNFTPVVITGQVAPANLES